MKKKFKELNLKSSIIKIELEKLIDSSCIDLLNDNFKEVYKKIIPDQDYEAIINKCNNMKKAYNDSCDDDTKEIIDSIFDDLQQFEDE